MFMAWFLLESDIWIETTFMRYGIAPNEIISITLKTKAQPGGVLKGLKHPP